MQNGEDFLKYVWKCESELEQEKNTEGELNIMLFYLLIVSIESLN